jgi:VanZ family protein
VVLYMAFIFGLSSLSNLPTAPAGSDKGAHVFLYAGLGALVLRALTSAQLERVTWWTMLTAVAISGLYGVSDELHQRFVPGRSFEGADMIADVVGSCAGAGVLYLWSKMKHAL